MAPAREGGGTDRARHVHSLARVAVSKATPTVRPPALRGYVPDEHIESDDSCPSFFAHTCSSPLEGPPLTRKMPERGQAARWSPQGSGCARQRHLAEVRGKGKRSRRKRMAWRSGDSNENSGKVGRVVRTHAA